MAILPEPTEVATKDMEKDTPSGTQAIDENADPIAYSTFTQDQKRLITLLIGLAMLFSPLSANIYLPCLPALQLALHSTRQLINLTITSYIVLQGIAPAFFGDLADGIGRRPVYLVTFAIYVAASLGLALQNNYAALLTLRMLQSLGCSATVAIGYGVIADVVPPAQRGSMLGPAMVATNLGPSLGPLIGGLLTDRAGWRWVFWFLLVMGAAFLLALILFLPETSRKLVGNGSVEPTGWNRTLVSLFHSPRGRVTGRLPDKHFASRPTEKLTLPNPFHSLRLIFHKDTALVLSVSAIYYTVYYCVQASLPGIFVDVYGYNELQIGLCYLAMGIGVVMGGYANGKLLDKCYRATAKRNGLSIDSVRGDDMHHFPIEQARAMLAYPFMAICAITVIGYGWVLETRLNVSVPLILQWCIGFISTCLVQTFNTLLVDIHSANSSTAAASGNITRCALSAGGVAAMQPLLHILSRGWYFTLVGCLSAIGGAINVYMIKSWGQRWRRERERESTPES
ncbi:hypothetical protein N7G274_005489 [Stereocaulon virgatum]|uniref:Major facilitator superfamily (MFS) profile domain-containing protein n=1 Tax=Stereocaulon virgatum TaxID=373712 RepID=A0ABR4A7B8_9LECA